MNYTELITKKKQYKYSANVFFDLKDEEKLAGFIPNVTTTEIIGEYLYSIIEKNNDVHSRILYGSYGTGKSHLLTVLCAILGHCNVSGEGFKTFCQSIGKYDAALASFLEGYVKEARPYLVVPVYSDFPEFDKCISYSLKKELDKNNIKICFKSYFYEARALLDKWDSSEESSKRLAEVCEKAGINLKELYIGLENLETVSEKNFNDVFKGMTFGATFVSETGNLIDNIELANQAIHETHRGIVFVFDEFGRYIEDSGEDIKVKVIQDLAEYCDHSEYDDYLILVSHKQLSLYTDKMKKELSEEWKKIEGRFKSTSINIKYDQCLSLIPHIIPKTSKWENFKSKYETELNELYNQAWEFKGFLLPPEGGNPFEGGFPLHPITLYALDRLSKKVAQNERTFFTYLASDEENSLFTQLKSLKDDKFHFIGLDNIYDYFESNIRSFRSTEVYLVYKKLQYALNKLGNIEENRIEIRVLKAMTVIYIISDSAILAADRDTLTHVIDCDDEEVITAIKNIEKLKIVKFMRQYGYYDFLDSSIYDLDLMIDEKIESISDDMAITTLNEEFSGFVIYPHAYNLAYHMNRIFAPVFVQKNEMNKKSFFRTLPNYYDGIIAFVMDKDFDEKEYAAIDGLPKRMIMLINRDADMVRYEVKRYIAIKYFYSKREELKKDDPTVEKELGLYLDEQRGIINDIVNQWRFLETEKIIPFMNGKVLDIKSDVGLSEIASELMKNTFSDTLIVNNDLINKNVISGAIKVARNKALTYIIEDDDIMKNCALLSPEHTIIRSVLSKNGLFNGETIDRFNSFPNGKDAGTPVKKALEKFLKKCQEAQTVFAEIFKVLKEPPFGLRDGYISILIANALKPYENVSLYFHGSERDYSLEELLKALENPDDYSLYICNWQRKQIEYIEGLERIFADYMSKQTKNRLKELHTAMNRHFIAISKAARSTDRFVSDKTKQYRDILSVSYKDYNRFFFEILKQISDDEQELVMQIETIRLELENVPFLQITSVEKVLRKVLQIEDGTGVVHWLQKKYEDDWSFKKHKAFDYHTNSLLEYLQNMNVDESDSQLFQDIAKLVTGFEIEYWNDSKIEDFEEKFENVIRQLDEYEARDGMNDNEIKIVIQAGNMESKATQFDKKELSGNSQIMFNKMKSTLDNFGQAISYEEKMQVIAKLLDELI